MKQLTTILLLLFALTSKAQTAYKPDVLNYDTATMNVVIDTVDAVVLSAYISSDNDYNEIRLDYVKVIRTGHLITVNQPYETYPSGSVLWNDLVYRPTEMPVWDSVRYYHYYVYDNIEYYLPYSKQVLQYWVVTKQ